MKMLYNSFTDPVELFKIGDIINVYTKFPFYKVVEGYGRVELISIDKCNQEFCYRKKDRDCCYKCYKIRNKDGNVMGPYCSGRASGDWLWVKHE